MGMRLAIIGFGSIGKFHCEQIKTIEEIEVVYNGILFEAI